MVADLRQVAERSGVSVSTASRALSGSTRVSRDTVARVQAAAAALGYRPNANARALRTARSQFVGLVVTNLMNESFHAIAEVVQRDLQARGFRLIISVTGGDVAEERSALHMLAEHSAAGVIVVGSDLTAADELRTLGVPTVHLARRPDRPTGDCVLGDEIAGARLATAHLTALGHRRIAVIAAPQDIPSGRERTEGYALALHDAGIRRRKELELHVPLRPDAGADAVARLLALPSSRRPTALLVANHEASYGALPAIREHEVAVPDGLSLVCYEDSQLARWWHPAVTVVDLNAERMGELAARLLLERMDREEQRADAFSEYRVGARLVTRDSCRPLP